MSFWASFVSLTVRTLIIDHSPSKRPILQSSLRYHHHNQVFWHTLGQCYHYKLHYVPCENRNSSVVNNPIKSGPVEKSKILSYTRKYDILLLTFASLAVLLLLNYPTFMIWFLSCCSLTVKWICAAASNQISPKGKFHLNSMSDDSALFSSFQLLCALTSFPTSLSGRGFPPFLNTFNFLKLHFPLTDPSRFLSFPFGASPPQNPDRNTESFTHSGKCHTAVHQVSRKLAMQGCTFS